MNGAYAAAEAQAMAQRAVREREVPNIKPGPERPKDVVQAMQRLQQEIDPLASTIAELEKRLEPFMRPEPGTPLRAADEKREIIAPAAEALQGFADDVEQSNDRLRRLLRALEV